MGRVRKDQESEFFKALEVANGTHIALFLFCGMTNEPLEPSIVPSNISEMEGDHWQIYLDCLLKHKLLTDKNGKRRHFLDGVHDIRRVFGRNMTEENFGKFLQYEKSKTDVLQGTDEQREKWGTGELSRGLPFTNKVYHDLDNAYETLAQRFKGVTDPQLEYNLITICKGNYIVDFLMSKGSYRDAQTVQKTIDNIMSSEQMRKKDEKPIEHVKVDEMVVRLEKNGIDFKTLDETQKALFDNFVAKPGKYGQSLDALDKAIYAIFNATRGNEDMQQLFALPAELDIPDDFNEFADEPSKDEIERARFVNIPKVQFSGNGEV